MGVCALHLQIHINVSGFFFPHKGSKHTKSADLLQAHLWGLPSAPSPPAERKAQPETPAHSPSGSPAHTADPRR